MYCEWNKYKSYLITHAVINVRNTFSSWVLYCLAKYIQSIRSCIICTAKYHIMYRRWYVIIIIIWVIFGHVVFVFITWNVMNRSNIIKFIFPTQLFISPADKLSALQNITFRCATLYAMGVTVVLLFLCCSSHTYCFLLILLD